MQSKLQRECDKLNRLITKNKDSANDSLTKVKEDLILRIEDLEKSQIEFVEENSRQHNDIKMESSKGIKSLNDEFDKKLTE